MEGGGEREKEGIVAEQAKLRTDGEEQAMGELDFHLLKMLKERERASEQSSAQEADLWGSEELQI